MVSSSRIVGHSGSPVISTNAYPSAAVSLMANKTLGATSVIEPDSTMVPLTDIIKSSGPAVP